MDSNIIALSILSGILLAIAAFTAGYFVRKIFAERLIRTAESKAREILVTAKRESESMLRHGEKEARQYLTDVQKDFESKNREEKKEFEQRERTLKDKEGKLDQK